VRRQRFVRDHERDYETKRLCELMEISRSGYYAWRDRAPSEREQRDCELTEVITEIHERSRRTYGAPRVHGELRHRDVHVGRKRVARLMRRASLVGAHSRRKWRRGRPDSAPAPDLVDRNFSGRDINEVLLTDITEFRTFEGKLFLAGVLDIGSNKLVGWSMSDRQTTELVIDAVVMAVGRRDLDDTIFHSDKGCQFTSFAFTKKLEELGLVQSFGSTGDCYDNAAMESFWATLKRELHHIHGITVWPSRQALRAAIFDYIEVFYNQRRRHSTLDYVSPARYERENVPELQMAA